MIVSLLLFPADAFAHPEGFSGLHVTISDGTMRAAITLHTRDLDAWFPPGKYPDYVADITREAEKTVDEILEVQVDGQPLAIASVHAFLLEVGLIEIDVDYQFPRRDMPVELLVWSKHLILMPRGHQQLLFIEDRRGMSSDIENGTMRLDEVLTVEQDAGAVVLPVTLDSVSVSSPAASQETSSAIVPTMVERDEVPVRPVDDARKPKANVPSQGSTSGISFFAFGVEHIVTGYDHLLFLAALLLTCTKFSEAATIVTCFTIAHSVTLAAAALDIVGLPGEIVEPAIALSIVYVAVENLFGTPTLWRRAAITCGFGLIHGLGFASALRDIGLGKIPGGVVLPLLKFNLGVEAGQLFVAALLLPLLFQLRRNERLTMRLVPAGSILVAVVGGYWFVTRVLSQFLFGYHA